MTKVINAGTISSGAKSIRCSVKLGTTDLATNHPASMPVHVRNSKTTGGPWRAEVTPTVSFAYGFQERRTEEKFQRKPHEGQENPTS